MVSLPPVVPWPPVVVVVVVVVVAAVEVRSEVESWQLDDVVDDDTLADLVVEEGEELGTIQSLAAAGHGEGTVDDAEEEEEEPVERRSVVPVPERTAHGPVVVEEVEEDQHGEDDVGNDAVGVQPEEGHRRAEEVRGVVAAAEPEEGASRNCADPKRSPTDVDVAVAVAVAEGGHDDDRPTLPTLHPRCVHQKAEQGGLHVVVDRWKSLGRMPLLEAAESTVQGVAEVGPGSVAVVVVEAVAVPFGLQLPPPCGKLPARPSHSLRTFLEG